MREKLREIAGVFKKLLQKRYRDPQKRNILVKNMDILYLYFPYTVEYVKVVKFARVHISI